MNQISLATKQAIWLAVRRGLSPLKTQIPQTAVEWCDEHFFLPEGSSQIPGRWTTQPVQKAILNMMGNDAINIITVQKPTRFGYTKMLCGALWYLGVHKKRSSVVYQPNDQLAKDFVLNEMDPLLPVVPAIQSAFPDWSLNNENNTKKKKICTGFSIDVRGAESPNNFRAMTKQVVVGDEIGAFSINGGEGDNLKVLLKRIQGAAFGKAIFGSTVVFSGDVIERLMLEADAVFKFHVPCPHCGTLQSLEWGDKDSPFGMKWEQGLIGGEAKAASAYYLCKNGKCQESEKRGKIEYRHLPRMEGAGRWICEKTSIWTEDGLAFFNEAGAKVKAPRRVGIKCSALYSLNLTEGWAEIVREWLDIKGDPDKLQAFINLTLGLHFDPVNTKRLDHEVLLQRREKYKAQVPNDVVYLTCGGDTQDNRMEGYVWGFTADNRKYLIDRFICMGDPRDQEVEDAVVEFCDKSYQREDGEMLKISRICWDLAGHRTETVYKLSKRIGLLRFIPCRGASSYGQPVQTMPMQVNKKTGTYIVQVGTDTAKDIFYADIEVPLYEQRAIHLPEDDRICNEDVCKQLVSEIRKPKKTKQGVIFVYDNEGRRNEALDCFNYALAALQVSIEKFSLDLSIFKTEKSVQQAASASFAELGKKLGAQ
ncbi:phage terminase large subunit family protein [Pseudoalteromonas sp. McH1-7]|uniref:terminase gpA endonuclease subunit n=1 Tax=Pseudoalteromonas sp. McH1-7 TaxID=2745574 RepID=UPI001590B6B8|nr:terminase gpA endonuclease subunit [Pseudoalteromonas sp. McH1-7]NUZ10041.1 phage terminase large subunit family protein [Pseudoalteromonas sp. McH1-7]